jgi:hypothetical protein
MGVAKLDKKSDGRSYFKFVKKLILIFRKWEINFKSRSDSKNYDILTLCMACKHYSNNNCLAYEKIGTKIGGKDWNHDFI